MKHWLFAIALCSAPVIAQQPAQMPDLEAMFFQQFDTNQDGKVDKAEFMQPTEAQFKHMDSNGDDTLDKAEVAAFNREMQQRMQEMQQRMQQQGGHPGMPPR